MQKKKKVLSVSNIVTVIICAVIIIASRFVSLARVVGNSMYPTFHDGNLLLAERHPDVDDIHIGDVIIFRMPETADEQYKDEKYVIKRVEGLPGDTIQIKDGILYRNGSPVDEGFDYIEDAGIASSPVTLHDGQYFVLGDNRNNSYDSRFFGPVSEDIVVDAVIVKIL